MVEARVIGGNIVEAKAGVIVNDWNRNIMRDEFSKIDSSANVLIMEYHPDKQVRTDRAFLV